MKKTNNSYLKEMLMIGLPITLQSIFQASYSFVDQLMVGSLGTTSIAGSGLGAKYSSLVLFTLSAISAVCSILVAQYHGRGDKKGMNQSFFSCLYIGFFIMLFFTLPAFLAPQNILGIYTKDTNTILVSANYLKIIAISFVPMTLTLILSAFLRSIEKSFFPLAASVFSLFGNIFFNYMFIFGKLGAPKLGLTGAAIGTLISRILETAILILVLLYLQMKKAIFLRPIKIWNIAFYKKISYIVFPILINEFSWSFGENIYAVIYGHLGTNALAAMTLTNPLQGLFIGMFSGISSAAVVMVGKRLGANNFTAAYDTSKYLIRIGAIGSVLIGGVLALLIPYYVKFFNIEPEVEKLTCYIVYALALVLFAKILNMIIAGGILRSGGNTKYTLYIDLIGTWCFGVPLGLIAAFVFHLPIYLVYFILSLEEIVRLVIGIYVFKSKRWMRHIT